MSLSSTDDINADKRKLRMEEAVKWLSGNGLEIPLCTETQSNLDCNEAVEAANAALEAVAGDPDNAALRTEAVYKAALARDMKYISAGRRRMFQLGVHNALRELYEGAKIHIDSL